MRGGARGRTGARGVGGNLGCGVDGRSVVRGRSRVQSHSRVRGGSIGGSSSSCPDHCAVLGEAVVDACIEQKFQGSRPDAMAPPDGARQAVLQSLVAPAVGDSDSVWP